MSSVRGCLPPLEGNRRHPTLGDYDMGVGPHAGGGDALSDLHTKLAHIQWRKNANDKSIRKALDTTKRLHERDMMLQLSVDREGERERWTEAIVRDELARPAEISETFLKDWEKRQKEDRARQLKETTLHLKSLKRVARAVQSNQGGWGSTTTTSATTQQSQSSRAEGTEGEPQVKQQEEAELLTEKLRRLRIGVKERRRDLRRSASSSKDLRGTFSATSFKTGRGRW